MPHISEYVKSLQIMESLRKAYTELYMTESARVHCVSGICIRASLFWALPSPRTSEVKQTKTLSGRVKSALGDASETVERLPRHERIHLAHCVRCDMRRP